MNIKKLVPGLALLAMLAPALYASPASAGVRVGTLSCKVGGGAGMLIVSSKPVFCKYRGYNGDRDTYSGTIHKVGVDVGFTFSGRLVWAVFEPYASGGSPDLAGRYSGASVEATALVGIGANVLLGGGNGDITLQPISLQGQTGINAAAGIGSLVIDRESPPVYYKGGRGRRYR